MISEIYYLSWAIRTLHPTKRVIKRRERETYQWKYLVYVSAQSIRSIAGHISVDVLGPAPIV